MTIVGHFRTQSDLWFVVCGLYPGLCHSALVSLLKSMCQILSYYLVYMCPQLLGLYVILGWQNNLYLLNVQ